jgi:hypothetical protein
LLHCFVLEIDVRSRDLHAWSAAKFYWLSVDDLTQATLMGIT